MVNCAYCGAWFGMDSAHQCVGSVSAAHAAANSSAPCPHSVFVSDSPTGVPRCGQCAKTATEIQADYYNRGYQAASQLQWHQLDAQAPLNVASRPDAAERRRYALLQAAAIIGGHTYNSCSGIADGAAAIVNAAGALLAEIERREKEAASAKENG